MVIRMEFQYDWLWDPLWELVEHTSGVSGCVMEARHWRSTSGLLLLL